MYITTQVVIRTADNTLANYASNTLHFFANDNTAVATVHTAIETVYKAFSVHFCDLVAQNLHEIKSYDDEDPMPRAPILETTFNLASAPTGAGLPPEVTLCMSFQGDKLSGTPQARRRGRIYIPFWDVSDHGTDGRPTTGAVTAAKTLGQSLLTASDAASTWHWVTSSSVAPGYATVTNGWVDNEWDTQRRRGRPATTRQTFT